jgi:hypothetical protein
MIDERGRILMERAREQLRAQRLALEAVRNYLRDVGPLRGTYEFDQLVAPFTDNFIDTSR